jgi:hypothetical protein
MKTIRKNFLLLAFAAGALFLIGNNVMADDPSVPITEPGYSCSVSVTCSDGGSVSCTGISQCSRWSPYWVLCDDNYTFC